MTSSSETDFKQNYQTHLKLKGLQPKTIEAYARAIRRIGAYFDYHIDDLSESQLTDYFSDLLESHSWSSVKLDLYGLKFFYTYVLNKPWQVHRNPVLLFPNRHGGLKSAHLSTTPLDRGGVQATLRQVAQDRGIKKDYPAQSAPQLRYPFNRSLS
jgi:site-specific recombinase XerD